MSTKICNKCNLEKNVSEYQKDKRRLNTKSYYQQPCKDCRNNQKKMKRKIDYYQNFLSNGTIKHGFIKRHCTNLKSENINEKFVELVREHIFLKRELKRDHKTYYSNGMLFCNVCNSIVVIRDEITIDAIIVIVDTFKKLHHHA